MSSWQTRRDPDQVAIEQRGDRMIRGLLVGFTLALLAMLATLGGRW